MSREPYALSHPVQLDIQSDKDLIQSLIDWGTEMLSLDDCDVDDPNREANLLLRHACKMPRQSLLPTTIEDQSIIEYYSCIQRRSQNEPFAYIVGEQGFWTLDLMVDPSTLIPRGDTETLIELLLDLRPDKTNSYRIVDLGTGTGCLLLSALYEYPKAQGLGVDISSEAVKLATENAKRNQLDNRAQFIEGSWGDKVEGKYDILLSNPPYITADDMRSLDQQVRCFEPITALAGGEDGLDAYRAIFSQLPALLNDDGVAIFEIGYDQSVSIVELAKKMDLEVINSKNDLNGIMRAVAFKLNRH